MSGDPLLGPLTDNGGPGYTHAVFMGRAVDAADDSSCPSTDQRGVIRPFDGDGDGVATCDIGSFEYDGPPPKKIYLPLTCQTK